MLIKYNNHLIKKTYSSKYAYKHMTYSIATRIIIKISFKYNIIYILIDDKEGGDIFIDIDDSIIEIETDKDIIFLRLNKEKYNKFMKFITNYKLNLS